ncbi:SpoIIAA family protein [Halodesulfovibrio marinisediminis]|uniref:SpoIIAA-like n=1 Tax=Halodesulfovibrio marinisediminis DSM 17456 TaxID=1121457 RepID=A0A1N6F2T9_9BACT|nr:STAS/SEC14 domain-containing protein [Halodesulfovibrio marinisediminis]SIN89516.1 SpoIIAA-like [Halodesulfovibrio marinisediminis DSM 17456]
MLKLLEGFDDSTLAVESEGEITHKDYQEVIIPRVKEILKTHDKVNCFMHFTEGTEYSAGAVATDALFGVRHLFSWNKIAIVTDLTWMHKGARYILPLMPFEAKMFVEGEYEFAKKWLESEPT